MSASAPVTARCSPSRAAIAGAYHPTSAKQTTGSVVSTPASGAAEPDAVLHLAAAAARRS